MSSTSKLDAQFGSRRRLGGYLPVALAFCQLVVLGIPSTRAADSAQDRAGLHPLGLKEQMIRDRFQRFEDRVYRLREQLAETEPDNAARLGRVLQRAGELGLADSLEAMIELFRDTSALEGAFDVQGEWLADADRLLAILLERDSDNQDREDELKRLQEYREEVDKLLEKERDLRDATAKAAMSKRMGRQIDQAIARINSLLKRQAQLSDETDGKAKPGAGEAAKPTPQELEELGQKETNLSRDTKQLAEDLKRIGDMKPEESADTPEQESAREKAKAAAESTEKGAQAMSQAGKQMKSGESASGKKNREEATKALEEAKKQLEEAKRDLEEQEKPEGLSEEQEKVAKKTGELSERMNKDSSSQGKQSSGGGKPSSPGKQSLNEAEKEMKEAKESLDESKPEQATPSQDRAIEQLEQAQRELEEALNQLRKEERAETLRDLEARFRDLLTKQRPINEATVRLDGVGQDNFKRGERLELADLATQQRALSHEAARCAHILDEDGTTIVVPRIMAQLSEDMTTVSERLAALDVAMLTQTIEREIVDTLEQLLGAVQKMQQENEQSGMQSSSSSKGPPPLLPPSAELKLLRASQLRVNTRTTAVDSIRNSVTPDDAATGKALRSVAKRQLEVAETAEEMRASQHQP